MSLAEIKAVKVYGETCIPYGTYKVGFTNTASAEGAVALVD